MIGIIVLLIFVCVIYIGIIHIQKEESRYCIKTYPTSYIDSDVLIRIWRYSLMEYIHTNQKIDRCIINACWKYKKQAYRYSLIKGVAKYRPDLGVLKNKAKYKLLIELGFMTTPLHMNLLINNHNTIVRNIYSAISEHINEN